MPFEVGSPLDAPDDLAGPNCTSLRFEARHFALPRRAETASSMSFPGARGGSKLRGRAGVLAVLQHLNAVDEHVPHVRGVAVRLLEGITVLDLARIEDHPSAK